MTKKRILNCCNTNTKKKKCIRKDGKIFSLPRRFTRKRCVNKSLETYLYNIYKSHNEKLYKILGRKIEIWEKYYNSIN